MRSLAFDERSLKKGKRNLFYWKYSNLNIYALLTKREVKMAGYWPSSFFCVCFYRPTEDEVEVHKNAKKERGQYPAILTEQAWSIKDLLYMYGQKITPSSSFKVSW